MSLASLPENTEALLLYLLVTSDRGGRSYETLRKMQNIEKAMTWLIENNYAYEYQDSLDLTLAGLHAARQVQISTDDRTRSTRDTAQITSGPVHTVMFDTHPLRPRRERSRIDLDKQVLHYLLAFDMPKNALPIPVLDGDILGRDDDADINLPEDDYISSQHCCFSIKLTDSRPTLYVEDLGSRNGTYVNKTLLEKQRRVRLEHGSRVSVGSTILIVVQIPR